MTGEYLKIWVKDTVSENGCIYIRREQIYAIFCKVTAAVILTDVGLIETGCTVEEILAMLEITEPIQFTERMAGSTHDGH